MSRERLARGRALALTAACLGPLLTAAAVQAARQAAPPPPSGAELEALAQPPARTAIASQRIYFVMTDRYANGDGSNDRGGQRGPRSATGYDPADTGWFHGGDLRGLTGGCTDAKQAAAPAKPSRPLTGIASDAGHGLARLRDLGFTAIWITPPFGQKAVQGDSAAYHGYWITDFTSVDPHLGTDADFAAFVECAHRLGLKVILDVVVNHTADVILPTGGSSFVDPGRVPYRDCRGRRFDPARYAGGTTFPCLKASNMPRVPLLLPGDRAAKRPGWLNDVTKYHNRGDVDFGSCSEICFEQGDFFGLDDLFTEQPAVVNGLAAAYGDWIRRYRVDGFRIDTARHVNRAFFRVWVPKILAIAREAGVPDFELFGEVFVANAIDVAPFVRDRGLPNVLDFALQEAAAGYVGGSSNARAVSSRLDDDDYYRGPSGIAPTPPTFLGNHDMGRAALEVAQHGGARGVALLRRVLLGYDLLYLLRGAPVVYYGDEVGMIGTGGDKAAREDMFPTAVDEWRTEERIGSPPIGSGSSFDVVAHPVAERLAVLGRLRDDHPALSTGATAVRRAQGGVLAFSRLDLGARREYLAVLNAGSAPASVSVPTATPSAAWTVLLGGAASATSGADGTVALTLPPLSTVLLRAETELPARALSRPTLRVVGDDLSELWRLGVQGTGSGPVSVAFAVRRAGATRWARVAADDSPPYRAFLDPRRYRRRERVHLVAIVRGPDGATAVSPVVAFTVRRR